MGWFPAQLGGLNRYYRSLFEALVAAGSAPAGVVVGPTSGAPDGVRVVSHQDARLLRRLFEVDAALADVVRGTDIIDIHFALYGLLPLLRGRFRSLPLAVHFHGPWAEESRVRGGGRLTTRGKAAIERSVYHRADAVVTLTRAFAEVVTHSYGVDPRRIRVIAPGVDLERFSRGSRSVARDRLGIASGGFVVASTRRLELRMGLDVLLEAWKDVRRHHPSAELLIAGEGPEAAKLEAAARTVEGVRLMGRLEDAELVELYRAANCTVVPSLALEGFGLVVLESLACGTPVVVTDAGGLPEAVAGLDPSLVVSRADPVALAARLCRAAEGRLPSPEEARAFAEEHSWKRVAAAHLDLYRALADRPIRVAYLGHTAKLSGGELALARVLPALQAVEATVVLGEAGPLVEVLERAGISVEVLPLDPRSRDLRRHRVGSTIPIATLWMTARYVLTLVRWLRKVRPDLVHTNSLKAALYGGVAGRLAGVPVVWHIRDRIAPDYLPASAVRLVRGMARHLPSAIIANSATTLETLRVGGIRSARVPSPVVHDAAAGSWIDRPAQAGGACRIGLVGRLSEWKGQDLFLAAFASAFPDGDEVAVVVGAALFGEDEFAGRLIELASDLGIADRVEFLGFREDIAAELAELDILVHASVIPEPFGQVVVEGMAAGLPVVVPDQGGPAEVVTHGTDGVHYRMADRDALSAAMKQLAGSAAERQRLGRNAQARAASFTPERVAEQIEAVYRAVLSGGAGRQSYRAV